MFALNRIQSSDLHSNLIDFFLYDWYSGLEWIDSSAFSPSDQSTHKEFNFL